MLSLVPGLVLATASAVLAQNNSFPHNYTGIPTGDYGPDWQNYFEVVKPLPNITTELGRNWAGNIQVDRPGFPNNTLFFWAFEKENGSLTAGAGERQDEPWGIWLNGGPGSSSMTGLLQENGPLRVNFNHSVSANEYSWNKLADYIWLDQPVGTGFATVAEGGRIVDEDQMAEDFWKFVANLIRVFPSLAGRPLYLTGESYAGTYIPYITKAYFSLHSPPTTLIKIAIGNGAMSQIATYEDGGVLSLIETFPELINFDPEVYDYFAEQRHLCGFDLNLTYPQTGGQFPALYNTVNATSDVNGTAKNLSPEFHAKKLALRQYSSIRSKQPLHHPSMSRPLGRRSLDGRANGTIDPWYQCFILAELWAYAVNYTAPWKELAPEGALAGVDVYDVPDALWPEADGDLAVFLNHPDTVAALHAPTSKQWMDYTIPVFVSGNDDPSRRPVEFFDELAKNASSHNISIVIYSGNDDSLVSHWGSEATIQNTTFGGIQGFSHKPSTEWYLDDGTFAGIVHQERNWTYALVYGAGHLVPQQQPEAAFVLLREFILGNNQNGSYVNGSFVAGTPSTRLVGKEGNILEPTEAIYVGAGKTTSTIHAPTASMDTWNSFMKTQWAGTTTREPVLSTNTANLYGD